MKRYIFTLVILVLQANGLLANESIENKTAKTLDDQSVFATVGNLVITRNEFEEVYQRARRQKFYHGKPSEKEQDSFLRKTAEDLIDRKLLLQEAERRGIQLDEAQINKTLDTYRQRYGQSERWQRDGSKMLALIGEKLREDQLLNKLKSQVKARAEPDNAQLKAFYQNNQDKFTEPETQRVSLILLKVDPSSSKQVWETAASAASELKGRIQKGEKFSALAAEFSGDNITAKNGGDMGYLHKGMLGQAAEAAVTELSVGEISDPVRVLEGVAIFRLEDRKASSLRPFAEVKNRAAALWQRESDEAAWKALKQHLRESTEIKIYFKPKNQV